MRKSADLHHVSRATLLVLLDFLAKSTCSSFLFSWNLLPVSRDLRHSSRDFVAKPPASSRDLSLIREVSCWFCRLILFPARALSCEIIFAKLPVPSLGLSRELEFSSRPLCFYLWQCFLFFTRTVTRQSPPSPRIWWFSHPWMTLRDFHYMAGEDLSIIRSYRKALCAYLLKLAMCLESVSGYFFGAFGWLGCLGTRLRPPLVPVVVVALERLGSRWAILWDIHLWGFLGYIMKKEHYQGLFDLSTGTPLVYYIEVGNKGKKRKIEKCELSLCFHNQLLLCLLSS